MPAYDLPPALVHMAAERRLIPFVGSGFSATLGLPGWREMLRAACDLLDDGPDFEAIEGSCGGNLLQIAEYLFIASGNHIGPLRQRIGDLFQASTLDVVRSGAHVELVNLGAPLVYTTNYDDLIERAHRDLGVACDVVALPRHLALGGGSGKPQIIKYHGDLRYEDTLVLTERSYYRRLDFESPMDLKFRSDLLGRSVLFLGYSFNDVNIRVIWHKLMQMMQDVPEQDRPVSWIVRFEPDPVQEALNLAAGIRTIILHPLKEIDGENYALRLQAFLLDLSLAVARPTKADVSRNDIRQFVSSFVVRPLDPRDVKKRRLGVAARPEALQALSERRIPEALAGDVDRMLGSLARTPGPWLMSVAKASLNALSLGYHGPGISFALYRALTRSETRAVIRQAEFDAPFDFGSFPWPNIYAQELPPDAVEALHRILVSELNVHNNPMGFQQPDTDILFALDLVQRLQSGEIAQREPMSEDQRKEFAAVIAATQELYPSLATYRPRPGEGPDFVVESTLQDEIPGDQAAPGAWDDEPPF